MNALLQAVEATEVASLRRQLNSTQQRLTEECQRSGRAEGALDVVSGQLREALKQLAEANQMATQWRLELLELRSQQEES